MDFKNVLIDTELKILVKHDHIFYTINFIIKYKWECVSQMLDLPLKMIERKWNKTINIRWKKNGKK